MPRTARKKDSGAIYHVMCRSITEVMLFRNDDDKEYYLKLLKRYTNKYKCSVYAYCLMSNHVHIHFDPRGYDISSFMHSINTAYIIYYNKKYDRCGHLFQERFRSIIVDSDRYNLTLSAYIHNNPKDIEGYKGREEEYEYSSYGIYLGIRKDIYRLVDMNFIKSLFGIKNKHSFARRYREFVAKRSNIEVIDKDDPCDDIEINGIRNTCDRKVIAREMKPAKVIAYVAAKLRQPVEKFLLISKKHEHKDHKAFMAYVLRVLCGMRYNQICEYIYSITVSGCSRLCDKGCELMEQDDFPYASIFDELLCENEAEC